MEKEQFREFASRSYRALTQYKNEVFQNYSPAAITLSLSTCRHPFIGWLEASLRE
jgi:hypothetical protein